MNQRAFLFGRPLRGTTSVVSDKSLTHRGVILALFAEGTTRLQNPNPGADCRATLRSAEALGAKVSRGDGVWEITGVGGRLSEPSDILDLENSGTGLRLLSGLLAGGEGVATLAGDPSLSARPMNRILDPLASMGVRVQSRDGGFPPLSVWGGQVSPICYRLPIPSAQVKSCLLLAGLFISSGELVIEEPVPSRDHTERLFEFLGIPLVRESGRLRLGPGPHRTQARDWAVPGDISAACFFLVAACLVPGSDVLVERVGLNPTRTGCVDVLFRMGADLEVTGDVEESEGSKDAGPEPVGTIRARASKLRGTIVEGHEIPSLIDEIPVLAVAAAGAEGWTEFREVGELRHKETDRLEAIVLLLETLGANVEIVGDTLRIEGVSSFQGGEVSTFGDHRIAMAARVASLVCESPLEVDSMEMVGTSDPQFEVVLDHLQKTPSEGDGFPMERSVPSEINRSKVVAIDGGAATGKTSTSALVAKRLGFGYVDSGAVYRTVALALHREGIEQGDDPRIETLLPDLRVEIDPAPGSFVVRLDGDLIGDEIRTPEISHLSSRLAVRVDIRDYVRAVLREACGRRSLVVEGRDIGTVVFPDAVLKVFLTASLEVRARRRWEDLQVLGSAATLATVRAELAERDERDSTRVEAPLTRAADAITVDTSLGTLEDQVDKIVAAFARVESGGGS